MIVLVNYATERFRPYQRLSSQTALRLGGIDRVIQCGPDDLDLEFRQRNAHLLSEPRGGGYWIWKPYLIERELQALDEGDCLVYADAGVFFTGSVSPALRLLRASGDSVMVFENRLGIEREWTKRDAFVELGCDSPRYADTNQIAGGISIWARSSMSLDLVREWLRLVQDAQLVTDLPGRCGLPDYPGFREHRHDQSIFSLLCKRRGIRPHRLPWRPPEEECPNSKYPMFASRGISGPRAIVRFAALPQIGPGLRAHVLAAAAIEYSRRKLRPVRRRDRAIPRGRVGG